jgi:hypothetical protein
MATSFSQKSIRITFSLTSQVFGNGSNTIVLEGYRTIVHVVCGGQPAWTTAKVQIFGMSQADMNSMTRLSWDPRGILPNDILIETNDGSGWQTVFVGSMQESGPDYSSAPDVALVALCQTVYDTALNPAVPSSYPKGTSVATVASALATAMSRNFENNGVTATLPAIYLVGSYPEQLRQVCRIANVNLFDDHETFAISPQGQPRQTTQVVLSPQSGMIGYPTLDNTGIQFGCLYNPAIIFGGQVFVQGDVPGANGQWWVTSMDHTLESEKPGGAWFSYLRCQKFGSALPLNVQ